MTLKNKYGQELTPGINVTYDVFNETPALQMIKPMQPYLRSSLLTVAEYGGRPELRWMYGENLKCSNTTTLDAETAYILEIVPVYSTEE